MDIERKRRKNERKYGSWEELPHNARRYSMEVPGHHGWYAKYLKEVDFEENTLRFWQEIYNEQGELVEIHEKYPVDKGHKKVKTDE